MPIKSLSRWLGWICLLCVLGNGWLLLPGMARDLWRIQQTIGKDALWRGAAFQGGERLANYFQFLRAHLPEDAEVVVPDVAGISADKRLSTAVAQFYLLPRRVRNCLTVECLKQSLPRAYILYTTHAENQILPDSSGQKYAFDSRWGVYVPPDGVWITPSETTNNTSGKLIAEGAVALVMLASLSLAGTLLCRRAGIRGGLEQIACGYGLGMFIWSFWITSAGLVGIKLTAATVIACWGLTLLCGMAFVLWKKIEANAEHQRTRMHAPLNVWLLFYVALAALSMALSVGKGYSSNDEIFIWGIKGYGMALDQSLTAITHWGTNTTAYPPHIPILIAGSKLLGGENLPASKLVFSAYFFCLLLYVDGRLSRRLPDQTIRGLAVLALGSTPIIFRHSTLAYANLPFSFYLLSGAGVLWDWLSLEMDHRSAGKTGAKPNSSSWSTAFVSALLLCTAMWTRPEGSAVVGAVILTGLYFRFRPYLSLQAIKKSRGHQDKTHQRFYKAISIHTNAPWLAFGIPFLLYGIFWWLVQQQLYPQSFHSQEILHQAAEGIRSGQFHLPELVYLLNNWFIRLMTPAIWGFGGIAVVVFFFIGMVEKKRMPANPALITSGLILTGIIFLYFLLSYDDRHDLSWWISTGLDRMWMPAFLFFWLGCWGEGTNFRETPQGES
ncbi:MAG: hypothetical protein ACOY16_09800 [Chloroflexota bacterium]